MKLPLAPLLLVSLLAAAPAVAATQDVALTPGFVFASPTVGATPALTSAALFSASPAIVQVFVFDAPTQSFRMHVKLVDGTLFGAALPLPAGTGFIMKCDAAGTLAFDGTVATGGAVVDLPDRFSLLGFPPLLSRPAARTLVAGHPCLRSVFRWNRDAAAFDFVMRLANGTIFGADFTMNEGEGYFLDAMAPTTVAFGRVAAADPVPLVQSFLVADPTAVSARVVFFTETPLRATLEIALAGTSAWAVASRVDPANSTGPSIPAVETVDTRTHDFILTGLATHAAYDVRVILPSGAGTAVEPLAGPLRVTSGAAAAVATPKSLAGKAIDATGSPVAGAYALVSVPGQSSPVVAVSNASGLFLAVLSNLRDLTTGEPVTPAPGATLRIDLYAPGRCGAGNLYLLTADDLPYAGEFVLP